MEPINREDLIPEKLYYIECLTTDASYNLVPNTKHSTQAGVFKNLKENLLNIEPWYSTIFEWFNAKLLLTIKNETEINNIPKNTVSLNNMWRFYEVKRFKIQNDMEQRVINAILKNKIKDDYFTWE